jgi:hypothetical protein
MPRELSYDWDKLVKIVKQDDEITQRAAAEKLGVSPSSLSILNFCQAKVEAGVESTAPATAKSVKDLRDRQGYRWEMIMAKTDLSKSDVIELYGGEEAAKASYTGRGRNFANGVTSTSKGKSASSKSKSASSKSKSAPSGRTTGRTTGTTKTATAKSKSAASKSKSAASKGRSTGRRSIAGNPS